MLSEFDKALLIANMYRCFLIVAGVCFGYMGYRLFALGFFEKAGELKAAFGTNKLLLKQVAPGVFFALFGLATIGIGVVHKIDLSVPAAGQKDPKLVEHIECSPAIYDPQSSTYSQSAPSH